MTDQPIFIQNKPRCNSSKDNIEVAKTSGSEQRKLGHDKQENDPVIEVVQLHAVDNGIRVMYENRKSGDEDGHDDGDTEKCNPMMVFESLCFFDDVGHATSISVFVNFGDIKRLEYRLSAV